jgi:CheY-like chemotaxis protein
MRSKASKAAFPATSISAAAPSSALRSLRLPTTGAASLPRTISASSTCSAHRNAAQARPGHRPRPRPRAGAAARGHHVGRLGTSPGQHLYDHAADHLDRQEPEHRDMSNPVTIIMIEDDEGHARLIERNIRRSGVNDEIVPFTSGTDALKLPVRQGRNRPRAQGQRALDPARSQSARYDRHRYSQTGQGKQIPQGDPVVVLTTTDDSHEIKRCHEPGCNVYITKPVKEESFANAIRQLGLFFSAIQVPPAGPQPSQRPRAMNQGNKLPLVEWTPIAPVTPGRCGWFRPAPTSFQEVLPSAAAWPARYCSSQWIW